MKLHHRNGKMLKRLICSQWRHTHKVFVKIPQIVPPMLRQYQHPMPFSSAIGCYHYSSRMTMRAMVVDSPFWTRVLEADMVFRGSVGDGCDGYGHSRSWVDLMSEETSSLSSKTDTDDDGGAISGGFKKRYGYSDESKRDES